MDQYQRIELMAPAGNFESLQAAIDYGADSIYFGVDQLNMRACSSINFTIQDLDEIAYRCNINKIHSYLALNTIIYDHDLSIVKTLINKSKKAGISAVIAMDQAVIHYAKEIGIKLHISTQLNITNIETVKFYSLFADTMVLSRELSLNQIKKIIEQIKKEKIKGPSGDLIKIEIFGHGALCMAISGKCYLSLHSYNSSANRGACKQNCRRKYTVIDKDTGFDLEIDNEHIMSAKDLCTISFLDKIIHSGINILKIEGRARSPEYVAVTTSCYREAIDSINNNTFNEKKIIYLSDKLKSVYNRGFWSGYYLGQNLGEWASVNGSISTQKKIYIGKGRHYYPKVNIGEFLIETYQIKIGDKILVIGPKTGVKELIILSIMVNDKLTNTAYKGQICTIPVKFNIFSSDKIYKIIKS